MTVSTTTLETQVENNEKASGKESKLKPNPLTYTNWLSLLTFEWITPLIFTGCRKTLELEDIWDLPPGEKCDYTLTSLEKQWHKRKDVKKHRLLKSLNAAFGARWWFGGVAKVIWDLLNLTGPLFIRFIIQAIADKDSPVYIGYIWAAALITCQLIGLFLGNQYYFHIIRVAIRVKSALTAKIFQKALKLSNKSKQEKTTGEIVNLMSLDAQKVGESMLFLHLGWSGIIQVCVILGLLVWLIGWTTFVGVGILILFVPIQGTLIRIWTKYRMKMLKHSDDRVKLINEILNGIRIIKFFNWEESFIKMVEKIRGKEQKILHWLACLRSFVTTLIISSPIFVSVITFTVYYLIGNPLDAATIFPAIAYFNMLRFPLMMGTLVVNFAVEVNVSLQRLEKYFNFEEIITIHEPGNNDEIPIKLSNCNFVWDKNPDKKKVAPKSQSLACCGRKRKSQEPDIAVELKEQKQLELENEEKRKDEAGKLYDINLEVKKGTLTCIVGSVGCGKSSLCNGLISEMKLTSGDLKIAGEIAYCPQTAWVKNATVLENITFGKPLNWKKLKEVINICALENDLAQFEHGYNTEIGEKGITISGGQRQRISLARAVYQDKDIYIFDDPLSAVDAHVGRHIFEQCINGYLKSKTRILVTHQLQYLRYADQVVVMDNGRIIESGTYADLMDKKNGKLKALIEEYLASDNKQDKEAEKKQKEQKDQVQKKRALTKLLEEKGSTMQVEERAKGSVAFKVWWSYFWYGGGPLAIFFILIGFTLSQAGSMGTDIWMSIWTDKKVQNFSDQWYLFVYCAIAIVGVIFTLIRGLIFFNFAVITACRIHTMSFRRIMRAPSWLFDTTPIGRFLSRFSKDQESLDTTIVPPFNQVLGSTFMIISVLALLCVPMPWFLIALIPLSLIYLVIQRVYANTSREAKRIEALSRSPMYAHFSESLNGLSTIRAYKVQDQFIATNRKYIDTYLRSWFALLMSQRWLSFRLEIMGAAISFLASIIAVSTRDVLDTGITAVALNFSLSITQFLGMLVTQFVEVETQMNATERLLYYTEVENESTGVFDKAKEPPPGWPEKGEIEFKDFKMRYRPNLPLVLRGLNIHIPSKAKIGVVGRTGAGKSSLMLALYRLVEGEEGSIKIDGIDIKDINLSTLRRKLSIIPQEPTLFTGTVRSNLDPFNQHTDQKLWDVLRKAHMYDAIDKLPKKLDTPVLEGGENFSVGQRQLLCLARSLCVDTKILILDECTANVDLHTDALIQKTIDEEFKDCTRLTIAHRLNTIIGSDKILVMNEGVVAEYDTPAKLLENPNGVFTKLVEETGTANARILKHCAKHGLKKSIASMENMVIDDDKIEDKIEQPKETVIKKGDIEIEITEEKSQTQ